VSTPLPTLTPADVAEIMPGVDIIADATTLTRDEWLDGRRAGLGGSDLAAILNISRWATPYKLWLEKTGRAEADDSGSTLAQRRGQALEPWILAEVQDQTPQLTVYRAPYQLRHNLYPELLANVDGLATDTRRSGWGGVEAKRSSPWVRAQWADGPPAYYEAQVQHYLASTGLDWWMVAADLETDQIETWVIERDEAMIETIQAIERAWWQRHVIDDVEPEVDASEITTQALTVVADPGAAVVVDEDDLAEIFTDLARARTDAAKAKADEDLAKNQIRQLMAEHTELLGDDGTKWATWRSGKPKSSTDWASVAGRLALAIGDPDTVTRLVEANTTTKPGTRTLRVDAGLKQIQES
jgi:putative phage-type endonuclease